MTDQTKPGAVVDRAAMLKAAKEAASVVVRRPTIPILSTALVTFDGHVVKLRATDLNMEMQPAPVPLLEPGQPFTVCVDAHRLAAVLEAMPGETVTVTHQPTEDKMDCERVALQSGGVTVRLACMKADDFPAPFAPPDAMPVTVNSAELLGCWRFLEPAISQEQTRYYLNGICLWSGKDAVTWVATDGHRLHFMPADERLRMGENCSTIMPRYFVKRAMAMMAKQREGDTVNLVCTASRAMIAVDGSTLITKCIDGTYPGWTRVVPKEPGPDDKVANIASDATDLLKALRLYDAANERDMWKAAAFAQGPEGALAIESTPGNPNAAFIPVAGSLVTGLDFKLGFNRAYLAEVAKTFSKLRVHAVCYDGHSPSRWTSPQAPGRVVVLMPMRV